MGSRRLKSLDVFRGVVIVLMFFVNLSANRAAFPAWIGHAGWNDGRHGQGLADFVFPWFLFIVGAAVPFSLAGGRGAMLAPWARLAGAFKRGLLLYALGLLIMAARTSMDSLAWDDAAGRLVARPGKMLTLGSLLYWDILPLLGLAAVVSVLMAQVRLRFALAFVAAVFVIKWFSLVQVVSGEFGGGPGTFTFRESLDAQTKNGIALARSFRAEGNAFWRFLGVAITQGAPACATAVCGVWAGMCLRSTRLSASAKAARLMGAGGVATVLACIWAWSGTIGWSVPFSKDWFTPSYVLLSAGTAAAFLGALCWWIDSAPRSEAASGEVGIQPEKGPGFFEVFGRNALAIYVVAELLWTLVLMRWRIEGPDGSGQVLFVGLTAWLSWFTTPMVGPWLTTGVYIGAYWLFARWLWQRGIFIRV